MTEWISPEQCSCACHRTRGVSHVVACCSGLPIDFWEVEYDPHFIGKESSKPKRRSETYEDPDEWLSFIVDKTTGKPLRGPGSDCAV